MRIFAIILLSAVIAFAQHRPDPTPQIEKMKPMMALTGDWEGSGWMQMGPQKFEFNQVEHIVSRFDGLLLEINGTGTNEAGEVVHNAFAVMSYNPRTGYQMNSWTNDGRYVQAEAGVADDGTIFWQFDIPQMGSSRYEISISEDGQTWHEKGLFSRDGETWNTFLEMNLKRVSKEQK